MNSDFVSQSFIPCSDDYQETVRDEHSAGDDGRWLSNRLRRGSSRASFQDRSPAITNNQTSILKRLSSGAVQTNRSQQQRASSPTSARPRFNFTSADQPIDSSIPPTQVNSLSSYEGQNLSQDDHTASNTFTDSLSYEDLTAMLNPNWEDSATFFGGSSAASDFNTVNSDDFNSLPRTDRCTPPPDRDIAPDLISPSRVIRNPRDLTSPRPSSIHDPFASSTFSRLDFQDQGGSGGLSGYQSPDFEQSGSSFQDDVFGDSAVSSSWAGPIMSGSGTRAGQSHWGSFRDRSFSTSHSEADMDWDADLALEDNRSVSPAVSLSPSSITGVMIPGGSEFMQSFPTDMISTPSRLHRLAVEGSSSPAGSSSQGHNQSFRSPSSLSLRSNRGLGGSSLPGSSRPLSPSQQLQLSVASMESPTTTSTRRRGTISPTSLSTSQSIQQRRRANARSTGALRSGPGPIRPSTAGGHSVSSGGSASAISSAFRDRAGTVSQIYMNPSSSSAFSSIVPYSHEARMTPSSSSLDEATNFSRPTRRPSSKTSMGDGSQRQMLELPLSQIQPAYDAYGQLSGEGGLPASLSSELANVSLGLDPLQLQDNSGDVSMMFKNLAGPSSMPMAQQNSSDSGIGRSRQQNVGETSLGWEDKSFVSTSNTSSLDATAQDDSLLSSRRGNNSFGPRGTETPLSTPASSPLQSREASFVSMYPTARNIANFGDSSEIGDLKGSAIDSHSDRSSTWPRTSASSSNTSNSLQASSMHQSRSSNAVQMLSPAASASMQHEKEQQRRGSKGTAFIDIHSNRSQRAGAPTGQGGRSSTMAVEPQNPNDRSSPSRWSVADAAASSASSTSSRGGARANQDRAATIRDAARVENAVSSSSTNYRSPVHEVLNSPNAAQVIEEVARRERSSRVKYNEVSAALDTLRLFLKQREDSLGIGSIAAGSSLRSAPSSGDISVASSGTSVGGSTRSTPARTLRHPPRGPLPPRGSVSSSSSSSLTQDVANYASGARSTARAVDDISARVTRMRQQSEQFSQQNLREAYRSGHPSNYQEQYQHQQHQHQQ